MSNRSVERGRPSGELVAVWVLVGVVGLAVLVTYARLPTGELYRVTREGLAGGLGRTLVYVNFPVALIAIGIVGALLERGASPRFGWVAIVLCGLTAIPGVVDPDDLDAKVVNVVPAVGVLLAVALTVVARPRLRLAPRRMFDPLRVAAAVVVLLISVPWFFAELGAYAPDPILADEFPPGDDLAAVHLGHHHGTDGLLLALAALLLSRIARSGVLRAYVALMFVYGLANTIQDAWHEQLVKRGTTDVDIPSLLVPEASPAWAILLILAGALWALSTRWPLGDRR